ncbi:hypothetical protein JCM10908_002269 [Rhodotorula pacifica]|uniref:uncharacterized protein n=1 Tax=Rhodotorula pacifica TaxID=1495444 RepID=UPI003182B534
MDGQLDGSSTERSSPTLTSLPTEIKIRIARMCRDQDMIADVTFSELAYSSDVTGLSLRAYSLDENDRIRYRPTLSTLFCTSREWHAIAAALRFERLRLKKIADPMFPFTIGPRYGHLVHQVDLYSFDGDGPLLRNLLAGLAALPNIQTVTLPSLNSYATRLMAEVGYDWADATRRAVETAFRRLIQSASDITVEIMGYNNTLALCAGSHIRRLEIRVSPGSTADPLVAAINACPGLDELKLCIDSRVSVPAFLGDVDSLQTLSQRAIKRLYLEASSNSPSLHRFIGLFASNLVFLGLVHSDPSPEPASEDRHQGFAKSISFPQLHTLEVSGPNWFVSNVLSASASVDVTPAVRVLKWTHFRANSLADDLAGNTGFRNFALARAASSPPVDIRLYMPNDDPPERSRYLQPRFPKLDFEYRVIYGGSYPPHAAHIFGWHYELLASEDPQLNNLNSAISERLRYTKRMADQAKATGDEYQLRRIMDALQECEWLQVENMS